ncbi:carbohydrate-binding domain-containing protein [Metabacillus bambusae]|uniref:Carbohydrate-binding domain-containing protein n=1 Tax=Metabacillus bambusae TaxID=2795218 RepID=A0ABS3MY48_9BACI|nr:carbohydrate-binding domain-containing protein [Metabacillus bambusae]MBO1510761.1 carbohydrate-binding domain-containing protein [Metabacillus bambusae]
MIKKVNRFIPLLFGIALIISGCSSDTKTSNTKASELVNNLVTYATDDLYTDWQDDNVTSIKLSETTATVAENDGVIVEDNQILIRTTGTYVVEGTLKDGQIVVDAEDAGTVRIILNGATINSSTSAPIYVKQADKTVISLEKNTKNILSDATEYVYEDGEADEPEAAIFSKDDLTINGSGTLNVSGNFKDGITSRDNLKITGGTLEVTSVDDGIVGRDLLAMKDTTISVVATGDGVKASNDEDETKGNIILESGSLTVQAKGDGVQAEKAVTVIDGEYSIIAGGGSPETIESASEIGGAFGSNPEFNSNGTNDQPTDTTEMPSGDTPPEEMTGAPPQRPTDESTEETDSEDTISTKGIKAGTEINIAGGTFTIDSLEDALHSDQNVSISDGEIHISTGDDGIHGDADVAINGGAITIDKSKEGIEGMNITIADGTIHVNAADDGVNINGGSSEFGMPGMAMSVPLASEETETSEEETATEETSEEGKLLIEGGYLYVNADGDGLDSNTAIKMTGGTVLVYGPASSGNGSLDYDQSFIIEGGTLVAAGSSGMAQGISEDSKQNAIMMTFTEFQEAGTTVYVEDSNGEQVFAIAPEKQYQTILISTPDLQNEQTYTLSSGGVLTGENRDGLYNNVKYESGSQSVEYTLSGVMTYLDESGVTEAPANGRFGGNGGGRRGMEEGNPFNTDQNDDQTTQTEESQSNQ